MKTCTRCRVDKPLEGFPSDRSRKDGLANKCRPCCYDAWKEWRAKNLERSQEYQRDYREKNPEKVKEWASRHVKPAPEKSAEYTKRWRSKNPERVQETSQAWRDSNREQMAAANAAWRQKYPDRHRQRSARYKARKRENTVEAVDYEAIIERDQGMCHICGIAVELSLPSTDPMSRSFDHVIPLSKGGPHSMGNVKLAHFGCNSRKGAR